LQNPSTTKAWSSASKTLGLGIEDTSLCHGKRRPKLANYSTWLVASAQL
jgi:hypothetical protein